MEIGILAFIGSIIFYLMIQAAVKAPGNLLQKKFISLGTLRGKSFDEIVAVVGKPSSVTPKVTKDGKPITICQWMATGYHIVLQFNQNDICLGVSHEAKV